MKTLIVLVVAAALMVVVAVFVPLGSAASPQPRPLPKVCLAVTVAASVPSGVEGWTSTVVSRASRQHGRYVAVKYSSSHFIGPHTYTFKVCGVTLRGHWYAAKTTWQTLQACDPSACRTSTTLAWVKR